MKKIRTVKGDIAPEQMGITTMHDHTITDFTEMHVKTKARMTHVPAEKRRYIPENFTFFNDGGAVLCEHESFGTVDFYVKEIGYFKEAGGNTIVDGSAVGMRRTAQILELADRVDVNIVCPTGLYTAEDRLNKYKGWSKEQQKELFEREIVEGMDGTNVRAGFLKAAMGFYDGVHCNPIELETVMACAELSAKYGMSFHLHPPSVSTEATLELIDRILDAGVEPDKFVMLHQCLTVLPIKQYVMNPDVTRAVNIEKQVQILEKGVNISIDNWGLMKNFPGLCRSDDYDTLKQLVQLIQAGYSDHIVLGHDFANFTYSKAMGCHGYTRILEFTMPMLRELGFGDDIINKLFVDNPARIMAF